jgi:hypothetical protein
VCLADSRGPDDSHGTRVGAGIIYVLQSGAGVIVYAAGNCECFLGVYHLQEGNSPSLRLMIAPFISYVRSVWANVT